MLDDESDSYLTHFGKLMDVIFDLVNFRVENKKTNLSNERFYYINLLTQKFLVHAFSVKKLLDGITIESKSSNLKVPISDPFSIQVLIRASIENFLVQNYLSNSLITENELDGRFEIWMRYGLKQRGIIAETEEEKRVTDSDEKSIHNFEESIKKREFYLKLSDEKKIRFLKTIDKEWKIIFDNDKFYPVSWKRLLKEAGIKESITDQTYNLLSWTAHSQSISILQLKDMWNKEFDKVVIRTSMKKLNMFIAFLASDIIRSDKDYKDAYLNLDADLKAIVNFYNLSYRGKQYAIEPIKNEA